MGLTNIDEIETYEACIKVFRGKSAISALMAGFRVHARGLDGKYPICRSHCQPRVSSWQGIDHDVDCPQCLERMKELNWICEVKL